MWITVACVKLTEVQTEAGSIWSGVGEQGLALAHVCQSLAKTNECGRIRDGRIVRRDTLAALLVPCKAALGTDVVGCFELGERCEEHTDGMSSTDCVLGRGEVVYKFASCLFCRLGFDAVLGPRVRDGKDAALIQLSDALVDRGGLECRSWRPAR